MWVITNIKLLEKLQPILEDREIDYFIWQDDLLNEWMLRKYSNEEFSPENWDLKTLTLEEALDLLPEGIADDYHISRCSDNSWWIIKLKRYNELFCETTLLETTEKLLEYLIDNNILK